jgi:5-methylcytosine-specific restriction endonuclease McrA
MNDSGEVPIWSNSSVGAAKRVAHYLATEVGEGSKFSKSRLREIVPATEQVDRRMRDLRKVGWKIRNYKDMASLAPSELYLEEIGDKVWEDGYRWPAEGLTAAKRRKVYERDGHRCLVCGIAFGDEYPDMPGVVARPTVGHIVPKERGGDPTSLENLRPECQLCNETARNLTEAPADLELLKRKVIELNRKDKRLLVEWMLRGQRSYSDTERIWSQYSQLPQPRQEEIREALVSALD